MVVTLLTHPLVVEALLPFLLVFAVVFAVLQKSEVLGRGKNQVDAIVALVSGLIVIAFANAVGIIIQLTAFLGVALVVLLILMILLGMINKDGSYENLFLNKGIRFGIGIIILIAVGIAALIMTGIWDWIYETYVVSSGSGIIENVVIFVIIIAAVAAVLFGAKGGGDSSGESSKKSG